MDVFWQLHQCYALVTEAARTSETSVNFYQTTRCNVPEVVFIFAAMRTLNLTQQISFITLSNSVFPSA
jgi:hypothetical protein